MPTWLLAGPSTTTTKMNANNRILIDAATYELLFMERRPDGRWQPAMAAMEAWREGTLRLYRIGATLYATMPNVQLWPIMTAADVANIDHLLAHPWIPDGSAFELPEDIQPAELPAMDALYVEMSSGGGPPPQPPPGGGVAAEGAESRLPRQQAQEPVAALLAAAGLAAAGPVTAEPVHVVHTHRHTWDLDALWRPRLLWDDPFHQRPRTSAAAALAALSLLLGDPEPSAPPAAEPVPARMPKHVADLVLRDAESRGATCPITMEPIKAADAAATSCGHVFQRAAIAEWLRAHTTCPECRQPCAV